MPDYERYHVEPLPDEGIAVLCTDCLDQHIPALQQWPKAYPSLAELMYAVNPHEKERHS